MIAFGMGNTLLTFRNCYYEYAGASDIEGKELTIGGFESAWLADLVLASFILLERCNNHFGSCWFHGIYRDNGMAGDFPWQEITEAGCLVAPCISETCQPFVWGPVAPFLCGTLGPSCATVIGFQVAIG